MKLTAFSPHRAVVVLACLALLSWAPATTAARRTPPGGVYSSYAYAMDATTGEVIFQKNADKSVPIASLTKLMTALVFVEQRPDLQQRATVTRADLAGGGKTQLSVGEHVVLGDLLHMSLMCSDNVAARILARSSNLSEEDFLAAMNHKALELGLTHTRFVECTGLSVRNVSTAADVARLVKASLSHPRIHNICTKKSYDFSTGRRAHYVPNTNKLLYSSYEVKGGKTGFISAAGYCFATWISASGREMIAVVLDAPTAATRFADVRRIVKRATSTATAQN
jgi:D-alanyl-D-alanine endopeptidase (penicillin-binding protein 7)